MGTVVRNPAVNPNLTGGEVLTKMGFNALIAGASTFVIGAIPAKTAMVVGAIFALTSEITSRVKLDMKGWKFTKLAVDVVITTALSNAVAGLALKVSDIAFISFLPLLAAELVCHLCWLLARFS